MNSTASRPQPTGYMLQLDALRAIAVIAVLVHHYLPKEFFLNSIFHVGPYGVRFFFVLSGFLITNILIKYKRRARSNRDIKEIIKNFYIRRLIRLFPIYYLLLFISLFVSYDVISGSFWWHFFHLSNIYFSWVDNWGGSQLLPHFWSLAVEEQFYLVWPIVVMLVPINHLFKVLVGASGFSILFRFWVLAAGIGNVNAAHLLPFSCLDSLCLGGLLTFVAMQDQPFARFRKPFLNFCFWVGIPTFVFFNVFESSFYEVLSTTPLASLAGPLHVALSPFSASLVFVWLVEKASWGFKGYLGSLLEYKPLLYIGKVSYGIYLYHLLTVYFIYQAMAYLNLSYPTNWFQYLLFFLLELGVAVAVATISWKVIEEPINRLKYKFPYLNKPRERPFEKSVVEVASEHR